MGCRQGAPSHDQAAIRRLSEGPQSAFDLGGVAQVDRNYFNPGRWGHRLDCGPLTDTSADGGIANNGHSRYGRRDLLEQFQPFRA